MASRKQRSDRKSGIREPNGRLSRQIKIARDRGIEHFEAAERETLSVALEARERLYGIARAKSKDQLAGSFVGRLRLSGEISEAQYQASVTYSEECRNNSIACASPRQPGAVDLNALRGSGALAPENIEWSRKSIDRYRASREAVMQKQIELHGSANLFGALQVCILDDHEVVHLIGDLRYALSALARHYKLDGAWQAGQISLMPSP